MGHDYSDENLASEPKLREWQLREAGSKDRLRQIFCNKTGIFAANSDR